MPNRKEARERRAIRLFAERMASLQDEVDDLKASREGDSTITQIADIVEDGVGISDEVIINEVSDPVFTYNDPDRGYNFGEWKNEYA